MKQKDQLKTVVADASLRLATRLHSRHYVPIDYPPNTRNVPRYGHGQPGHRRLDDLFSGCEDRVRETLGMIRTYDQELLALPARSADATSPSLVNDFLPGLDSAALYAFIRSRAPRRYVEIGSGNSTKIAARAISDGNLSTRITSIDPYPRAEIDTLCDDLIRCPLQEADLDFVSDLERGDAVFFDGSHVVYLNNDVSTFFLDVLPEIPPGVLVGIHDIYLPDDYPQLFADRYYTEQYMLGTYLLANPAIDILLPAHWVTGRPSLAALVEGMWDAPNLSDVERHGVAFWMETR